MPFAVEDFHDLVRLLEEHPQWRVEVRRLVLSEELLDLPALVRRLAEAQERAEQRLAGVEDRQAGVEDRLTGVEGRLDRVEAAIERLADAQARTDEQLRALIARLDELTLRLDTLTAQVGELARQMGGLRQEVGALAELVGAGAELEAERTLLGVLEQRGYRFLERARSVALDGEVDVATRVTDATGQSFSVLVEAKARLRPGDIAGWRNRLQDRLFVARLRREGFEPPFLVYAFGLRVYAGAEEAGQRAGIGVLDAAGELVAPVPSDA